MTSRVRCADPTWVVVRTADLYWTVATHLSPLQRESL
jgi:hypothetical protein